VGPGAYNVDDGYKSTLSGNPRWRFGTGQKCKQDINQNPGPGAYSSQGRTTRSIPKYSFRKRLKPRTGTAHETPGPGTYNVKVPRKKIAYTMRPKTGVQPLVVGSQRVGPGTYEKDETIGRPHVRCVFSKSTRFKSNRKVNRDVGPGSYNLPGTKSNIAYTMRPRTGLGDSKKGVPGPGHYFPKVDFVYGKTAMPVFGRQKRDKENARIKALKNVGPGSYNPKFVGKRKGWTFGRDRKLADVQSTRNNPGPGQYDIKSFLECYPAYATWKIN